MFDEFKSDNSLESTMSFHLCNSITDKTIHIIENKKLLGLLKYFDKYSHKALKNVKYISIDLYSTYTHLIKNVF